MRASEFEPGFIVIETGRTPEASLMAGGAILRFAREGAELTEMNVFVAFGALPRSLPVNNTFETDGGDRGFMALVARNAPMGSRQVETRRGVIERRHIMPRAYDVAGFAACFPVCAILS